MRSFVHFVPVRDDPTGGRGFRRAAIIRSAGRLALVNQAVEHVRHAETEIVEPDTDAHRFVPRVLRRDIDGDAALVPENTFGSSNLNENVFSFGTPGCGFESGPTSQLSFDGGWLSAAVAPTQAKVAASRRLPRFSGHKPGQAVAEPAGSLKFQAHRPRGRPAADWLVRRAPAQERPTPWPGTISAAGPRVPSYAEAGMCPNRRRAPSRARCSH